MRRREFIGAGVAGAAAMPIAARAPRTRAARRRADERRVRRSGRSALPGGVSAGRCRRWGGPASAAICGLSIDGVSAKSSAIVRPRWSWFRSHPMWGCLDSPARGGSDRTTGQPDDPDCVPAGHRSGRLRLRQASLAAGGNATGFMQFEFSLAGKWLQFLREVAPGATRIGMFREARNPAGIGQWAAPAGCPAEPTGLELP